MDAKVEDKDNKDESASDCSACLAAGKDFCIASSRCITRATFQCNGPHDHITGDKEFALHGNPDGIQHSMVCPASNCGACLAQGKDFCISSNRCIPRATLQCDGP